MSNIQQEVSKAFLELFGRTPLKERQDDILGEAIEFSRAAHVDDLKEELGDLLASALMACEELGVQHEDIVRATLEKVKKRKLQYKSLGRKTKVAILGGAFNPPTVGHIAVAQYVLNTSKTFDEVWLMPCYKHMYGKEMVDFQHRFKMCEIAASEDGRIKAWDYEGRNQLKGETYHLVKLLQGEEFAKHEYNFSIIIGMDNANTFSKWVNYELLEKMIAFVVVPRAGVERQADQDWYLKPPHIFLGNIEGSMPNISSTEVREYLKDDAKDIARAYLNEGVYQYIQQHGFYQ